VANRSHVHMRLRPLKFLLCHVLNLAAFLFVVSQKMVSNPVQQTLQSQKAIENVWGRAIK
jgi:hypothetical protein